MDIFDYKPDRGHHQWSGQATLSKSRRVTVSCDNCGVPVTRRPSQIKGKTTACSKDCAGMLRRVRVKSHCVICGKEMELTPSNVVQVVTCSRTCQKMRQSYDAVKHAPRLDQTKETRDQFCTRNGLTRSQFRYRQEHGIPLDAKLAPRRESVGVKDVESGRSWPTIAACARELGVAGSTLAYRMDRGERCNGSLIARSEPE